MVKVSKCLILDRIGAEIFFNHQRNLKDNGMVKLPQVEAGDLLDLLQPVDQCVAVNKQLPRCFRHVEVVFEEPLDGEQRLLIETLDRATLENLTSFSRSLASMFDLVSFTRAMSVSLILMTKSLFLSGKRFCTMS